jgi:hypothetical protein
MLVTAVPPYLADSGSDRYAYSQSLLIIYITRTLHAPLQLIHRTHCICTKHLMAHPSTFYWTSFTYLYIFIFPVSHCMERVNLMLCYPSARTASQIAKRMPFTARKTRIIQQVTELDHYECVFRSSSSCSLD